MILNIDPQWWYYAFNVFDAFVVCPTVFVNQDCLVISGFSTNTTHMGDASQGYLYSQWVGHMQTYASGNRRRGMLCYCGFQWDSSIFQYKDYW